MFRSFEELLKIVQALPPLRVSLAGAESESALRGVQMARERGLVEPVLVGNRHLVEPLLRKVGLPENTPLFHEENLPASALKAAELVRNGEADILLKGQANTTDFMRGILDKERGLRTDRLLSILSFFEIPGWNRMLCMSDGGINIAPALEEKEEILRNALKALHLFGLSVPKVAVLAANEKVHPKMQSSVDAQALAERYEAGAFPGCILEGPMAMDVILREDAAIKKGLRSTIAGKVDLILLPSMDVGNAVGKTLVNLVGAEMGGLVLGAAAPALITSRSESPESKLYSMALAALYIHKRKEIALQH
ncbi:MAG TPA: phosphate acyltransferase [Synergistaceae bacterium]|nr:phosphate acyltransferase [Synergistaceae bacterium]HPJ25054.1 phosphate acyltransferase [Synergistaceae bacterium]HPQ38227.1 phosphate acyltransferase [Synergistaceae bacterium]